MASKKALVPVAQIQSLQMRTFRLSQICDLVDGGVELTEAVRAEFNLALLSQSKGIDEFLDDREYLKARIEKLKEIKRAASDQQKKDEALLEAISTQAVELIEGNPNLPFNGSLEKLATAKNPPSVEVNFPLEQKSFLNLVTLNFISLCGVPDHYYQAETVYRLNLKEIGEDLKAGKEIVWAQLKQKKRLHLKLKD